MECREESPGVAPDPHTRAERLSGATERNFSPPVPHLREHRLHSAHRPKEGLRLQKSSVHQAAFVLGNQICSKPQVMESEICFMCRILGSVSASTSQAGQPSVHPKIRPRCQLGAGLGCFGVSRGSGCPLTVLLPYEVALSPRLDIPALAPQGHSCSHCTEPEYTVFTQSPLLSKMFMHASAPMNILAGSRKACSAPRLQLLAGLGKGQGDPTFRILLLGASPRWAAPSLVSVPSVLLQALDALGLLLAPLRGYGRLRFGTVPTNLPALPTPAGLRGAAGGSKSSWYLGPSMSLAVQNSIPGIVPPQQPPGTSPQCAAAVSVLPLRPPALPRGFPTEKKAAHLGQGAPALQGLI